MVRRDGAGGPRHPTRAAARAAPLRHVFPPVANLLPTRMFGLTGREARFAVLISSSHLAQHVYLRVVPPLIPVLAVVLEYPLWQLGLLLTMFGIGLSIAQAPLGILADRIDRVYLLPVGIVLAGIGYVMFAFAPTLGAPLPTITLLEYDFMGGFLAMSVAMIVVGVGLAIVDPAGYPMISENVAEDHRGTVLGYFGAASKLGDGLTPAVIAGLILVWSWESIVLAFGLVGVGYGLALFVALQGDAYETAPAAQRQDESERTDVRTIERRRFLYPVIAVYGFFLGSGFTSRGLGTFYPAFLAGVYAFSTEVMGTEIGPESLANLYFAVLLLAGAGTQLVLGSLADTRDHRTILVGCMAVATVGMIALALLPMHALTLVGVTILLGAGLFGVNPPRDAILSEVSPPEYEGRTFGYVFTAAGLTGAIFPTIIGYLMETVGFREGFVVLAAGTIVGMLSIATLYSDRVYLAGEARPEPAD